MPGPGLKLLDNIPNVQYEVFSEFLPEITPGQIKNFDLAISVTPKWTYNSLVGNNQLISVLRCGVGYDTIDVEALNKKGVMLCITSGAVRRPMAIAILTLLLALSTRLFIKDKLTRDGLWSESSKYYGYGLTGKILGSIGVGNIGHEMFTLTKSLGMKNIAYDPYINEDALSDVDIKLVDFDTVLTESDFLNISCPLNEESRHMIGEDEFFKMKRTSFLINTARGAIVNERALIKALEKGWIRGAGIDVYETEPVSAENPLLKMNKVIVTPHALGHTDELFATMWDEIIQHITQIMCGEAPNGLVNRKVWSESILQLKIKKMLDSLQEI